MPAALEVVDCAIDALTPFSRNARTHSEEQVRQIADSIKEFGFTSPVLISPGNTIVAGHGRVMAARLLGMTSVPTITLMELNAEQLRAYVIADNKMAENAGWDREILAFELKELAAAGYKLDLTGFSALELKGLIGPDAAERQGKTDPDAVPAVKERIIAQAGDVWILGRHRLLVGDATNLADVQRLMGDQRADLVWTDPPYNVDYRGQAGSIINDAQEASAFGRFLLRAFQGCHWAMRDGAVIYVTHADMERWAFTQAFETADLKLSQVLIWVKNSAAFGRQDYNWQHEPILYGWKEGAAHYFAGDFTQTTVINWDEPDAWIKGLTLKEARAAIAEMIAARRSTVIHQDRPSRSELHPTMKPVALVQRMVEASSLEEQLVFDPFAGSGTTLITAEKTNRRSFVLELDPRYADVIIRRWQDFTGRQARHSSGETFAALEKTTVHKPS